MSVTYDSLIRTQMQAVRVCFARRHRDDSYRRMTHDAILVLRKLRAARVAS